MSTIPPRSNPSPRQEQQQPNTTLTREVDLERRDSGDSGDSAAALALQNGEAENKRYLTSSLDASSSPSSSPPQGSPCHLGQDSSSNTTMQTLVMNEDTREDEEEPPVLEEAELVGKEVGLADHHHADDATLLHSLFEKSCFASGIAGYRIIRLSMELFLILRVKELDMGVSKAGTIFLLYSVAALLAGLIFLWYPSIFWGSRCRSMAYFFLSVGSQVGGFVAAFNTDTFEAISGFAIICGMGAATWAMNYQTITNCAFGKAELGSVAKLRQVAECLGFLLPSICLAIVESTESDEGGISIVRMSASALGAIAAVFHLLSFQQIVKSGATIGDTAGVIGASKESIWDALKIFFGTSLVKYFLLNAILLAASNILMGTMSLITEEYFGIEATFLWIAAIGFPIGGMLSIAAQMIFGKASDAKTNVINGTKQLVILSALCVALSSAASTRNEKATKAYLFFFGLIYGMVYTVTFAASLELWLVKLKGYATRFVSRACVINNFGVQGIMAIVFLLQTISVEEFIDEEAPNDTHVVALIFFAPLMLLGGVTWIIAHFVAYPPDPIFFWPVPAPFSFGKKMLMKFFDISGILDIRASSFGIFQEFRMAFFSVYLCDITDAQKGPELETSARLCADDLRKYLEKFDQLDTREDWWYSKATLLKILLGNEDALEKRLELASQAKSTIWILIWVFEESSAGNSLADALIKSAQRGVDVRVIVDAVELYYLHERDKLCGGDSMAILKKLAKAGISLKMLDSWYGSEEKPYVIGTHRKIFLVDDTWLITGGRNINDKYFSTNSMHYHDCDVSLRGDFGPTTAAMFVGLWEQAKETEHLFERGTLRQITRPSMFASESSMAFVSADSRSGFHTTDSRWMTSSGRPHRESIRRSLKGLDLLKDLVSPRQLPEFHEDWSSEISLPRGSFLRSSRASLALPASEVSLFQLDHKGGNPDGHDIIFSTLLYLIETAKDSIDLVFGYFQLFQPLDDAITRAVKERGVKIRLVTNSNKTNGLAFFNRIFRNAIARMLEIGVEVYLVSDSKEDFPDDGEFCLHYKIAVIDLDVALVGSWNCLGTSVFYDDDFSVVMFDDSGDSTTMFEPLAHLMGSKFR